MTEQTIMSELYAATRNRNGWASLASLFDNPSVGIHLAVMLEPFLTHILEGRKTIESRFSKNAISPFQQVAEGDLVLLKAGPIVGSFRVSSVTYVIVEGDDLLRIRRAYSTAICAEDDAFWEARAGKRHVTLIGVSDVRKLSPVHVSKKDMRGWVTLTSHRTPLQELRQEASQSSMYVQDALPLEPAL
jgi:hypothetical protein